jgi:large subunit ribosomal protein L3
MIGLLGKKIGQTRIYDDKGNVIPVTVVKAGPNRVIQCKTVEKDGYRAVQLGFDDQKESRVGRPLIGHFKRHNAVAVKRVREFRDFTLEVKPGDVVSVGIFAKGDYVDAIGTTKGRGFEGVMARHGFRGGDASHGAKGFRRRPGAIGQRSFPGTIMRGTRMPGHMGQVRRTVQNLLVVQVREDDQVLLIRGAIPGAKGDYVVIREAKKNPKVAAKAK